MKRSILACLIFGFIITTVISSCSTMDKANIKGGKVTVEKDGVVVSAEIQTKDPVETE